MGVSIAELVTYQMAETEADLKKEDYQPDYDMIKGSSIERAKLDLYGAATIPDESLMHMAVKFYLSDCSVIYLIDVAIDFYKSKSRLSDVKEGANYSYYDKVSILQSLKGRLSVRVAEAVGKIKAIIFGTTDLGKEVGLPSTTMLSEGKSKVTVDPFDLGRTLYGDYIDMLASMIEPYPVNITRPTA